MNTIINGALSVTTGCRKPNIRRNGGGGCCNYVMTNATNGGILGGFNNCISGAYSAVLGGCNNNDNGISYVGLFGCNVTGVQSCAMHANNFVAQNIPPASTGNAPPLGAPTGTLYYVLVGGYKQVWIA